MTAPEMVLMKRYRCPYCHRSRSKERAAAEHIARCWLNPGNRTCKTCAHRIDVSNPPCAARPGCECQDGDLFACDKGVELAENGTEIKTGCPLWADRDDIDDEEGEDR